MMYAFANKFHVFCWLYIKAQADFSGLTRANAEPIIFNNGQLTVSVSINITDDNLAEGEQHFSGRIISGGLISDLIISAPVATIRVADNDGK